MKTIWDFPIVVQRDMPNGVIFCSHATRRALIATREYGQDTDVEPMMQKADSYHPNGRLTGQEVFELLDLAGRIRNRAE